MRPNWKMTSFLFPTATTEQKYVQFAPLIWKRLQQQFGSDKSAHWLYVTKDEIYLKDGVSLTQDTLTLVGHFSSDTASCTPAEVPYWKTFLFLCRLYRKNNVCPICVTEMTIKFDRKIMFDFLVR